MRRNNRLKINILSILLIPPCFLLAQGAISVSLLPEKCLTEPEVQLAGMINSYRAEKGLPPVTISASLSYVARTHAEDLADNYKQSKRCNMHSWSGKGNWTSCCYTDDHKRAACMWSKPRELTSYTANGYEIAYYTTQTYTSPAEYAHDILKGWKGSPGHNETIINRGIWKKVKWNAMGVGLSGGYACVWFGEETDPAGSPSSCK